MSKTKFTQHRSPQTNKAKAPYNFVPLPEKVLTLEGDEKEKILKGLNDKYHSDRHTGYIDLEITTETPLYTRCATPTEVWSKYQSSEYFENDKPKVTAIPECQDFFHHGDEKKIPVIPGSTLRGMTRALVEILSYSKISFVSEKQLIYRAVADSTSFGNQYREKLLDKLGNKHFNYPSKKMKGGYLEIRDGKPYIRPAQEHPISEPEERRESFILVEGNSLRTGSQIFVHPATRSQKDNRGRERNISLDLALAATSTTSATGLVPAAIVNTKGVGGSKHMAAAFYEKDTDDSKLIPIPKGMWSIYEEDRDMQRGIKGRELRNSGEPLFYLLDEVGKLFFFGPTMMFRLPYTHKAIDLIPEEVRNAGLDMAESIFGMVDEDSKKAIASRVYFSDAVWQLQTKEESPFLGGENNGRRVPKILSSPKPTSFQLYLNQYEPNHHHTDPTRWFLIKDSSIEKMKDEGVPENIRQKIETLKDKEFENENDYLNALRSLGINFNDRDQNSRNLKKSILNCSSHELRTYNEIGETEIRGFKRYWHKRNLVHRNWVEDSNEVRIKSNQKQVEKLNTRWEESKQHTIIRPVKPNTMFKGKVYFENLSCEELGALLVALDLPENMRHQIGMAKPYGLGSVRIVPTLVIQERVKRYESLFESTGNWKERRLDDIKTLEIKKSSAGKFKNRIKSFVGEISFNKIQRLKELFTMLAWKDETPDRSLKNYTPVTDPQWRSRHVLQFPTDIDQVEFTETEGDVSERQNELFGKKLQEITEIKEKELLRKTGKRILELNLADGQKKALAKALLAKAAELQIDVSQTKWFPEISNLAKDA